MPNTQSPFNFINNEKIFYLKYNKNNFEKAKNN